MRGSLIARPRGEPAPGRVPRHAGRAAPRPAPLPIVATRAATASRAPRPPEPSRAAAVRAPRGLPFGAPNRSASDIVRSHDGTSAGGGRHPRRRQGATVWRHGQEHAPDRRRAHHRSPTRSPAPGGGSDLRGCQRSGAVRGAGSGRRAGRRARVRRAGRDLYRHRPLAAQPDARRCGRYCPDSACRCWNGSCAAARLMSWCPAASAAMSRCAPCIRPRARSRSAAGWMLETSRRAYAGGRARRGDRTRGSREVRSARSAVRQRQHTA